MQLKRGQIRGPLQSLTGKNLKLKFFFALAASAILFWIDIRTPLSFPDIILYPILLIYAFYNLSKKQSLALMILNMAFILTGLFISPADIRFTLAAAHRGLIIGSSWAAYFLVWQGRARDGRLKELEDTREALEKAERHYHTLFDTMVLGVIYRDANGKVLSINPAAKRILGSAPAKLTTGSMDLIEMEAVDEDGAPLKPDDHPYAVARRTGRPVYNFVMGFINPEEHVRRWVNVSAVPLFRHGENTPYQIYTIFQDITELKTAHDQITGLNKALARKIHELEAIIKTAPIGIAISYDPDCTRMEANPYFSRLLSLPYGNNMSKTAPEGQRPTEFKICKDGRELAPEELPMQTTAKLGVPVENMYLEVRRKDGAVLEMMGNTAPLFDETGKPRGAIGAFLDVTELKKAEQQLKDSLKEKEVLIKELYHRTKNNINVISNLLLMQMNSIKDPELRRVFQEAQGRIHSMSLVHEMLYNTRELSVLDLKSYIGKLAGYIMASNKEAGNIKLGLQLESVPVSLYAAVPCGLIINELLSNGIKHAFPDGPAGEITLALRKNGHEVELAYSDNGRGMPDGFRIEKSSSLGLKLVNNLAKKQLRGSLEIKSDNGASITVRFDQDRLEEKNGA